MAQALVVTDSTSDLPADLAAELGIVIVPLNVHFGEETYLDGQTLTSDGFWAKLHGGAPHPKTSQPAPGAFLEVYRQAVAAGRPVVSVHVSAKLSGTLQSAQIAKGMVQGGEIHLVDTLSVSLGLGLLAAAAARMARAGMAAAEIARRLEEMKSRVHIFFGLDTLEYLQRGGRIGKAQALLGGLLGIKPILAIKDGEVHPADKVRGKGKVLPRVTELLAEVIPPGRKARLAVMHAQNSEGAEAWMSALRAAYRSVDTLIAPLGPVVATHGGPGTIGVAIMDEPGA